MKKLLSILGTIILTGTATTSIISCKAKNVDVIDYDNNNLQTDMVTMFNIVT
ncbi:lipoprotein [Spiroplasma endosymbiont of Stenodema calcarata]|uniref:lipoprotein n=1 Tax=Spiroplasma endosymbiont of Stenodema calcarata TaxID=3139328 RepID=UPI003CCA9965